MTGATNINGIGVGFLFMLKQTVKIKNGDWLDTINIYKCDITGEEIPENHGWYGNDKIHISDNGIELLIEQWIKRNSGYVGFPIFLHYLIARLCNKIRPDRYISKKLKDFVLKKYKHKYNNCGVEKNLEIDHIKPISKKGLTELKNLQVLCKTCNIKKSNK
ncbi:hypothetical protein LCGC14_0593720 [marine sediment metagenome]|uniref:HNH nuclease domain-containing protein n=1 Tax=marine sediment metagenome TaxID=412755 RepID=A0A0F9RWI4_9ZZZZ